MNIKLAQAFVMALCLYATTSEALLWEKPTDAEIATLPPYCPSRLRGYDNNWLNSLGSIYNHVHHYCVALVYLNRYYKISDPGDRKALLRVVLSNIEYMFLHGDQSAALIPEIRFTKGRVLVLDGRDAEATKEFLHAIQLKPSYTAPYLAMADFYVRIGKKQDALEILQEGLRQTPRSRSLARRYEELGGKLPLPDTPPLAAEIAMPEGQPPVPAEAEKKVVEATPVAASQVSKPEQETPIEKPSEKIGSSSNPWCRFCIDDEPTPAEK